MASAAKRAWDANHMARLTIRSLRLHRPEPRGVRSTQPTRSRTYLIRRSLRSRDLAGERTGPAAVAPLVHREPDIALPLIELKRPRLVGERQMILMAALAPGYFPVGPDDDTAARAFSDR